MILRVGRQADFKEDKNDLPYVTEGLPAGYGWDPTAGSREQVVEADEKQMHIHRRRRASPFTQRFLQIPLKWDEMNIRHIVWK